MLPAIYNANVLNRQPTPQSPNNSNQQFNIQDEKFVLPPVELDGSDILALEHLLNTDTNASNEARAIVDEEQNQNEDSLELNTNLYDSDHSEDGENNDNVQIEGDEIDDNGKTQNDSSVSTGIGIQSEKDQTHCAESNSTELGCANSTEATAPAEDDGLAVVTGIQSDTGESSQSSSKSEANIMAHGTAEKVLVTQIVHYEGDEIQMTYVLGEQLRPRIESTQVKVNDKLSGNLPFHENVSLSIFCSTRYIS